jgi:serine/threonine-protein kinase HipA
MNALPYCSTDLLGSNAGAGFSSSLGSNTAGVSAIYSRKSNSFKIVAKHGSYRLSLELDAGEGNTANQLLTARLAQDSGIMVAPVGSVQTTDSVPVLWAARFDRCGASNCQRFRIESACQLLAKPPMEKYSGTIEDVATLVRKYCTNPKVQLLRLYHRVLFAWLVGDSSLHLKKWSLLQNGSIIELAPAYSLQNRAISARDTIETALSIQDRHVALDRECLLGYLAREICGLNDRIIARTVNQLGAVPWEQRIRECGLSKYHQRVYFEHVSERWRRLTRGKQ